MGVVKSAGIATGGVAGGGGITVGGGYAVHRATLVTVGEQLEKEEFKDAGIKAADAWNKMKSRVTNGNENDPDEVIKALTVSNENVLKTWCESKKLETYESQIKPKSKALLDRVKKFCYLIFKEKIETNKVLDFSNGNADASLTAAIGTLKNYTNPTQSSDDNPILSEKLLEIKTLTADSSKDSESKSKLKQWCDEAYKKPFKGNEDNEWRLVNKFCIKNS